MQTGTIVGSYQLLEQTGETNWSTVFAARRVGKRELYEANVLHASPENLRRALADTVRRDRRVDASHLAPPPELKTAAGRIVLVARDHMSESLADLIEARVRLPLLLSLAIVGRVARALDKSLRRPHGDLCPANIHLRYAKRTVEVRYAEIALAISRLRGSRKRPIGSLAYFSPERLDTPKRAGIRSDVYTLGLVLYELVTERPAIVGDTPDALVRAVADPRIVRPRDAGLEASHGKVEELILRATHRDPSARYRNLGHFADAVEGYVDARRPGYDMEQSLATYIRDELGDRVAARKLEVSRILESNPSARPARPARPPRRPPPRPEPEARPFVDPATNVPANLSEAPTDDLAKERVPLRAPLAPLIRLLFLGALLVVSIIIAMLSYVG